MTAKEQEAMTPHQIYMREQDAMELVVIGLSLEWMKWPENPVGRLTLDSKMKLRRLAQDILKEVDRQERKAA